MGLPKISDVANGVPHEPKLTEVNDDYRNAFGRIDVLPLSNFPPDEPTVSPKVLFTERCCARASNADV
ncbi:hypothetical protein TNCV_461551 [Trichonephila clavipes]|nr:hypothetical protein TNCV_461551 [Trichonephila clavipes]